jgi:hypothetical protein
MKDTTRVFKEDIFVRVAFIKSLKLFINPKRMHSFFIPKR